MTTETTKPKLPVKKANMKPKEDIDKKMQPRRGPSGKIHTTMRSYLADWLRIGDALRARGFHVHGFDPQFTVSLKEDKFGETCQLPLYAIALLLPELGLEDPNERLKEDAKQRNEVEAKYTWNWVMQEKAFNKNKAKTKPKSNKKA